MGYNPWGREESDMTDRLHFHALEKEMATYSSALPGESRDGGAWWAAVYGVPQSWTRLKQLRSSSTFGLVPFKRFIHLFTFLFLLCKMYLFEEL